MWGRRKPEAGCARYNCSPARSRFSNPSNWSGYLGNGLRAGINRNFSNGRCRGLLEEAKKERQNAERKENETDRLGNDLGPVKNSGETKYRGDERDDQTIGSTS